MSEPSDGDGFSRRIFIHRLTFFGGGVVLLGGACTQNDKPAPPRVIGRGSGLTTSHRTFTSAEYAVMAAAAERIVPRDQDPGALDANVPEYIDRMLTAPELSQMRDDFIQGTNVLDRRARGRFQKGFAELSAAQQDQLLTEFKDSAAGSGEAHYYELLVTLTLEGLLGDPSYGGNKDRVGWALVGFGTSEPPMGYDGEHHLHCSGGDTCKMP